MNWQVYVLDTGDNIPAKPSFFDPGMLKASTGMLPLRYDLVRHSPDGFGWGYPGSACAQLACALIADALEDDRVARDYYQRLTVDLIQRLDKDKPWAMSDEVVRTLVRSYKPRWPRSV